MPEKPLIEIECNGSSYEMGLDQGKWLKPRSHEVLKTLTHNRFVPRWLRLTGVPTLKALLTIKGLHVRSRHFDNMQRYTSDQFERLRGIADGSGLNLALLLGVVSIETMTSIFQYVMGCTSIGIDSSRSKTGSPLLAYNHDFPDFFGHQLLVRRSRPRNGHRSIQLTYPSIPGAICGINDAGLAVSLNHAFSIEPLNDGVPPSFLVQQALDNCETAEQTLRLFQKAKFSNGSMTTILDKDGRLFVAELSRGRFGVRNLGDGLSLTLNEYQLPELKQIEVPQDAIFHPKKYPDFFRGIAIHRHNWERRRRFEQLLASFSKFGPADIKRLLSDHDTQETGGLGTICRHHLTANTIASAILHPRQGLLEVARGFACEARYQRFKV